MTTWNYLEFLSDALLTFPVWQSLPYLISSQREIGFPSLFISCLHPFHTMTSRFRCLKTEKKRKEASSQFLFDFPFFRSWTPFCLKKIRCVIMRWSFYPLHHPNSWFVSSNHFSLSSYFPNEKRDRRTTIIFIFHFSFGFLRFPDVFSFYSDPFSLFYSGRTERWDKIWEVIIVIIIII